MRTLISYRHTGADLTALESLLENISNQFAARDIEMYCAYRDPALADESLTAGEIMKILFPKLDTIDFLFVLLNSDSKSEGMLMEVGYCIAKGIPIIVAKHTSVQNTYLHEVATQYFDWTTAEDVIIQLQNFQLQGITAEEVELQ